jgi:hypothetical protein
MHAADSGPVGCPLGFPFGYLGASASFTQPWLTGSITLRLADLTASHEIYDFDFIAWPQ